MKSEIPHFYVLQVVRLSSLRFTFFTVANLHANVQRPVRILAVAVIVIILFAAASLPIPLRSPSEFHFGCSLTAGKQSH